MVDRRSSDLLERLRELEDRQALASLLNHYVAAVDAFDWDAWGACWAPDAIADFGRSGALHGREAIVEAARSRQAGYQGMQHLIANAEFAVAGDTAEGYGNLLFSVAQPGYAMSGKYRWQFERTPEGWWIRRAQLSRLWTARR
jgi:hypothetical protein